MSDSNNKPASGPVTDAAADFLASVSYDDLPVVSCYRPIATVAAGYELAARIGEGRQLSRDRREIVLAMGLVARIRGEWCHRGSQ